MSEISVWLWVGTGGAMGAVLRGLIYRAVERGSPLEAGGRVAEYGAARSTWLVNVLGSFLLGLLVGGLPELTAGARETATLAFLGTGLCGSLTTLSTLSADAVGFIRHDRPRRAVMVLLANTLLGIAALMLGLALMR